MHFSSNSYFKELHILYKVCVLFYNIHLFIHMHIVHTQKPFKVNVLFLRSYSNNNERWIKNDGNERKTNKQLANSTTAVFEQATEHSYIQTPAITIKTASYIANCNNGIKINAPMRMGNQRQKVTNWYFVLFCFIRSLRLEDTWEWERGRHTKTLDK